MSFDAVSAIELSLFIYKISYIIFLKFRTIAYCDFFGTQIFMMIMIYADILTNHNYHKNLRSELSASGGINLLYYLHRLQTFFRTCKFMFIVGQSKYQVFIHFIMIAHTALVKSITIGSIAHG